MNEKEIEKNKNIIALEMVIAERFGVIGCSEELAGSTTYRR